jgi:hypothetical protein
MYYPDPWPGTGLICLGSGTSNNGGNVNIAASVNTGNLPIEGDKNSGAKNGLSSHQMLAAAIR